MKKISSICVIFFILPQLLFAHDNTVKHSKKKTTQISDVSVNSIEYLPPLLKIKFNHANVDYEKQLTFLVTKLPQHDINLRIEAKFAVDEKNFTQEEFKHKIENIIKQLMSKGLSSKNITVKAVRTNLVNVSEIQILRSL